MDGELNLILNGHATSFICGASVLRVLHASSESSESCV